jgi:hypothetical protein
MQLIILIGNDFNSTSEEIFNEGGIKIISLSNIRQIIIYFHSSQCRLIQYLHQRPIFFKANSIHSSIVAILELIRGAQCLIEVNHLTLRKGCCSPLQHNFALDPMIPPFVIHFSNFCHVTTRKLRNWQTSGESASLPQYLGCNIVFDMRLRVTFLCRKTG